MLPEPVVLPEPVIEPGCDLCDLPLCEAMVEAVESAGVPDELPIGVPLMSPEVPGAVPPVPVPLVAEPFPEPFAPVD